MPSSTRPTFAVCWIAMTPARPCWREVLRCRIAGNLQDVLEEHAHALKESLGLFAAGGAQCALCAPFRPFVRAALLADDGWSEERAIL